MGFRPVRVVESVFRGKASTSRRLIHCLSAIIGDRKCIYHALRASQPKPTLSQKNKIVLKHPIDYVPSILFVDNSFWIILYPEA